jgi:hypothetical protein
MLADDPQEKFTRTGVTRLHHRHAVTRAEKPVPVVKPQLRLARGGVGSVAMEAGVRKDRQDLAVEIDRRRGFGGRRGQRRGEEEERRQETAGRHGDRERI